MADKTTLEGAMEIALKSKLVGINRERYLRTELGKRFPAEVVDNAILFNPAKAGIPRDQIDILAKSAIKYETLKVTTASIAASLPGGAVAVAAAALDLASYFVFVIRIVQKLAYLYGFQEFNLKDDEDVPDETSSLLTVFMGVMFGVQGAATGLKKAANVVASNISKNLAKQALTKKFYWPIVKKIGKIIGNRITKQVFADTFASAIPYMSGVLSGALTFAMYRPNCYRLMKNLQGYKLCDPEFYINPDDPKYADSDDEVIDGEFYEVYADETDITEE